MAQHVTREDSFLEEPLLILGGKGTFIMSLRGISFVTNCVDETDVFLFQVVQ